MNLETRIKDAFMRHEGDVETRPRAWVDVERRVTRNHKRRVVGAGVGAALAITGAALALPRIGKDTLRPPLTSPGASEPQLTTKVDAPAFRLDSGRNGIWGLVASPEARERGRLLRIDPSRNSVTKTIEVGESPGAFAVDDDAVWVTHNDGCYGTEVCLTYETVPISRNSVARLDPATGDLVANIDVYHPQDVESVFGAVWVTSSGDRGSPGTRLVRIDPATNEVTASINIGDTEHFSRIDYSDRYLWLLNPLAHGDFQVVRVDPSDHSITRFGSIDGSSSESAIVVGYSSVWVTTVGQDSASGLARLDPATGEVIARITLPDAAPVGLLAVSTGEDFVWATSTRGYLWKVDPNTNKPVGDPVLIGDAPPVAATDVVTGFGSVWVASGDGKIWRLEP